MLPKTSLNRTAKAAVQELRDAGVIPTLDEILWLNELGKIQENPVSGENIELIGIPAKAGNAYLWPMTICASQWLEGRAWIWFGDSMELSRYCLAFALAHGRGLPIEATPARIIDRLAAKLFPDQSARTLDDLVDRGDAYRAVKHWARSLKCKPGELDAAIDAVLPATDKPDEGDEPKEEQATPGVDVEELAQDLAMMTGIPVEDWRKRTSLKDAFRAFLRATAIEKARQGQQSPPVKDAQAIAIQDVRTAVVKIMKQHKEPTK